MTVLFCDLVDSVGMSVRLDPEELMRIFDLYRTCCDEVIAHHHGFLARFMGDGVLAYFGYPHADEDDAANAIRAGIELLERIRGLDPALVPPLQGRVGIATGLVVVSGQANPGDARSAEIVGKMPNLAARLQSIADPGSVTISNATRRVTRGQFTYRDLGAVPLKGFSRPVQAWVALPARTVESRFRARLQGAASPLVGRKRELDMLAGSWAKARAGHGQVVQVVGEPGIGKSRLTEAIEERIAKDPHVRVRWFCSPQHVDSSFYVVKDQLERAAAIELTDPAPVRLNKLARLVNASDETTLEIFASLFSIPLDRPYAIDALTPEKRKEVTMAALAAMFGRLVDTWPVLMVVEDVHWIDATSLELLQLIVERTGQHRVLLLVTARPEFKQRWTNFPFVTAINLERLDPNSAAELCAHVAADALSPKMLRQVVARCDGIPLFAEELTKTVVESFGSDDDETSDNSPAIPSSLHDSLVARLDRLGTARYIANVGAVIGRRFDYGLLAAVAARPESELQAALRRLTRSGLVNQSGTPPASTYLFKHALIRDAAYDSLLRANRQELHGQIASVLLSKFPDLAESEPEVLAFHLSDSGAPAKSIPHWDKAGQRAASRAAHVEATDHYGAALDALRKQPESAERAQQELSLLIRLAISLSSSRGYAVDEVRDVLTQARELCDRLGNVADLYPVLRGLCTFSIVRNDLKIAEALARRCLQIGEQTGHVPFLIEGDTPLGYILVGRGEYRQAQFHLERALHRYAENEQAELVFPTEQDPRMSCSSLLAIALHFQGDAAGAERASGQALAWARALDRPFDLAYALCWASAAARLRGNYLDAKRLAEEAVEVSQTHGFGVWLLAGRWHLACAIGHLGQIEEAIALMEPAVAGWSQAGVRYLATLWISPLAEFQAAAGRLEQARTSIDAAITEALSCGDLSYLSGLHRIRADIMAHAPAADFALVAAELRQAISIAKSQGAATLEAEAAARLHDVLRHPPLRR